MDRSSRRTLVVYLLYAVLSIVFCSPLFARPAGVGIFDWDQHLFYYAEVLKNVVEYGQPPFWSPWYCGGNVMWQNPQVALLSPVYPLTAIAGLALAMKLNIVLHYWVGLIGMHLLLTRVVKLTFLPGVVYLSCVFTFAGACVQHLAVGHSVFLPAFYLPLLLFFLIRALEIHALGPALYSGGALALMIYNGGLHIVPMAILAVAVFSAAVAAVQRSWRPLVLALLVGVSGAAYAAPKLVPVSLFVTGDRFWDARDQPDHPDRETPAMMLRGYVDSSQSPASRLSALQRHGWWEYGNYIGTLAAFLIASSLVWLLTCPPLPDRQLGRALAVTSLVFLALSAGEFSAFAPATLLQRVPLFSSFRIPSRYTIGFVLFGTLAAGCAVRALFDRMTWTRTRRVAAAMICAIAVVQLVAVNRTHFHDVFSLPPLDSGFRVLNGSGTLERDAPINPYTPNAPMLRALMSDKAVMWCYEGLQLTHGADLERPFVWTQGQSKISSIAFTPNRVQFSVIGGVDRSKVFLNQNYAPGWRSTAGPVQLDPQAGGRMYVELAPGQTGRFAFSFVPPGLMFGGVVLLLAIGASVFARNRALSPALPEPRVAEPRHVEAVSFTTRVAHLSKPIMLISIALAIATRVVLSDASQALALMGLVGFGIAFLLSLRRPEAVGLVLVCTYVAPLVVARLVVFDAMGYLTLWMSGLLGAMLPRWPLRRWSLPASWRVPLVGWGLAAAAAWPIIAAREFDFHPDPFSLLNRPTSAFGMITVTTGVLVADTAAAVMLAVLWLDWLFATFAENPPKLVRAVIAPLLASCAIACGLAAYQLFADIRFLNPGWGAFGRSGATMIDANAFGIVAVLGSCGFLAVIDRQRPALWNAAMLAGFALSSVGLWASGSKTALIGELIVLAFAAWSLAPRPDHHAAAPRSRRPRLVRLALACVIVGGLVFALAGSGPAQRLGRMVPRSVGAAAEFAAQLLWRRDGYGTAAMEMIRNHPLVGIGVGTFGVIVGDYQYSHLNTALGPDNAQNWVRHYLAEFGLIGSLGWIVWAIVMSRAIARSRARITARPTAMILAGGLVALVAVSQVGLPMTNPAVALTFWTFLFWFCLERAAPDTDKASTRATVAPWQWLVMVALLAAFGAGTLRTGLTTLSVPMRARNAGWGYAYGISRAQLTPAGEEFRWTQQRAVVVVPAEKRVAKLTIWVSRPDVAANPVLARVWHEQRLVIDTVLRDNAPVSAYVLIDRDPQWLMVRTYMDRILPPNAREKGLALQWTFLDAVPTVGTLNKSMNFDPATERPAIAAGGIHIGGPTPSRDIEADRDVLQRFGERHAHAPRLVRFQRALRVPAARAYANRVRNRPVMDDDIEEAHRMPRRDDDVGAAIAHDPESSAFEPHAIVERVHHQVAVAGRVASARRVGTRVAEHHGDQCHVFDRGQCGLISRHGQARRSNRQVERVVVVRVGYRPSFDREGRAADSQHELSASGRRARHPKTVPSGRHLGQKKESSAWRRVDRRCRYCEARREIRRATRFEGDELHSDGMPAKVASAEEIELRSCRCEMLTAGDLP